MIHITYTTEMKEEARKALQRGEREVMGHEIITSKIDLDVKLDRDEKTWWEISRRALITSFGGVAIDIIVTDTERGQHTVINWMTRHNWTEQDQNFIQLLLGDDQTRFKINRQRLERGIGMEDANILFSRVLQRFTAAEESKLKRAVERIVGEIG